MTCELQKKADSRAIEVAVCGHLPAARLIHVTDHELGFRLPADDTVKFKDLFQMLESSGKKIGVNSFGLTAASLESVFLSVAETADRERAAAGGDSDQNENKGDVLTE